MAEVTRRDVELWIREIPTGEFHYTKVLDGNVDPKSYNKLRKIMFDLVHAEDPCVEPVGKRDGYYRPIEELPTPIDWQSKEPNQDFPVILPFDLRKYVWVYPNSVIIVAGAKSSAKTGFMYRTAALNMNHLKVILLSNMEGGEEQMRDRFSAMDIEIPAPAPFLVFPAFDNFHDFIKYPNTLYLIDYIDVPESGEFFMIGGAITKIREKLDHSVAVIALQKPYNRDIAFGGEGTLKDAALYLAMNPGSLKIVDCKKPANPKVFPKNMKWSFTLSGEGTNFINIQPSMGD